VREPLVVPANIQEDDIEDDIQRGPRIVAKRIQKQIMKERFPNFPDAEN